MPKDPKEIDNLKQNIKRFLKRKKILTEGDENAPSEVYGMFVDKFVDNLLKIAEEEEEEEEEKEEKEDV